MMAKNLFQFHGSNEHTQLTGDKVEISNLCRFFSGMIGVVFETVIYFEWGEA